jgi:hypothetical protein
MLPKKDTPPALLLQHASCGMTVAAITKVRDREDAIARSRDTRAPRNGDYASETHALLHFDFDRPRKTLRARGLMNFAWAGFVCYFTSTSIGSGWLIM